ncbi:TetR family transcriptional regulator [Nocardioides sp. dk4132]|uniref:TetR/AcrR family transcriptional regulator n=1 Tax=unclassified Nocardioides TaxID=2615069 RepID=UPI0012959D9F|nr:MULTISPECIES: TetR family transcriptional regulator [unclassified Nocardioides]MQW77624.1 TetR family transcriptional regulator [Nocardioides sp. dk4132]QGA06150.1 TetR family transcriptional regulator [Nocardioides sp. dk884]
MTSARAGRPSATTHARIAAHAEALFEERGYSRTAVGDIADRAGIARRTFFAYFASKADAFWYVEDVELRAVTQQLAEHPRTSDPLQEVIDVATSRPTWTSNDRASARSRMATIDRNPELMGGALRFQRRWQATIAEHLRRHLDLPESDLLPEVVAAGLLAISQEVINRWLDSDENEDLAAIFTRNVPRLRSAFEQAVTDEILR